MRCLIPLVLCLIAVTWVNAEPIDIGSGTLDLPANWVMLEDKRDCFVGEVGIHGGIRNEEGTVWIIHTVLPPEPMRILLEDTEQWNTLDSGTVSGFDYKVVVRPNQDKSPILIYPQTRTLFQIILTDKGHTDPTEMLRWWTPPQGERFEEALAKVKAALFDAYSPVDPDTNKEK